MPQQTQNGPPPGYREVPAPTDQPPPGYKEVPAPSDPNDPLRGAAQATSIGPNNPAAGTRFEGVADLGERLLRMFGAKMPFGSLAAELTGQKGAEKGEEPRLAPEELIPNRASHPILTAGAEFAGGLTSPTNVAILAGTGGAGDIPLIAKGLGFGTKAAGLLPRLLSLGFGAQMIKGAYDQYEPFRKAMEAGDEDSALYHFTHGILSIGAGAWATQHGLSEDPVAKAQQEQYNNNSQRLALLNSLPPEKIASILTTEKGTVGNNLNPKESQYLGGVIAGLPEDQRADMTSAMASHLGSRFVDFSLEGEKAGHGYLAARDDIGPGVAEVAYSELSPEYRGKGLGIELYKHMAEEAAKGGFTRLISDYIQTPEAERLWKSLVAKGYASPLEIVAPDADGVNRPQQRFELDMAKALGQEKYDKLIGSKLQQVSENAPQPEGQPVSGPIPTTGDQGAAAITPQAGGEQTIRNDTGATGGEGTVIPDAILSPVSQGDGGQSAQRELSALIPEFNKLIGGGEGAGATSGRVGAYPAIGEDEPPPPVISRLIDDDLAAGGINVVHRGRDIGIVSRILGSFNETARKLDAEGHPLGSTLRSMSGLMSEVTKTIAVNQTDTMKAFINGAQKLVSRDEWSNGVARLMDRRVDERPAGTPDNIWNAYQSARALDESLRLKIIDAKRRELQLNGFSPEQAQEWYPDTWGKAGEHYPHMYPGTWTITRLAEVDERGNETYEPISHENISWRAESEIAAKKAALAYLQAHPGEQLRVRQDTISTPASGITDRTRLRDLNDKIKEATTTIVDGGADPQEVLRQLMDQSGAAAYGPRNAAKRQFGPALQRETNLLGWTRDIEDFKDYLLAGERYVQLAPARQLLMKARNQIAGLAGMPQVQKISEFPAASRYFAASQYGNLLARVDSAIEGLEGHPGAWDAGMRYIASGMGFDPDIFNKAMRPVQQVVALTKLGFQPARVLSHGLQTMWAVYPVLGEKATLQGIAHSFDPHYSGLIHDLAVTHSGNMSDIEGLREYAGAYFGHGSTPIDWAKGTSHIIRDLGLMPFTMGIDFTRRVAATGAYIQGLERGLDAEAAKGYARDVMDRTTGMYNAADNSTLLRQLPGPVAQFKGFMLKTMQFMFNLRGAELARFGAAISLMGVVGFPAIRAMSNMVEQATGYNPENDLKRKFPVMSRGIFGLAGVDQPSSVGFADWFASRPGIPLAGVAGPAGSDILNFAKAGMERFKGPSREAEQDLDQAIRQLSPEARRVWDEAIRGTRLPTPGLIDPRTGASILHQLTPLERIEAIAGFTPLRVAEERETHESIRNQLAKSKDQRGYFVDKLAENQLELMRPGLSPDQKADLIKEMVDLQKLAVEYNQARNLAPAVRDRIRGMLQERLERDIRKAPKGQRPFIQGEIQRYQQEQQ